jgi:hypothetical protein
LDLSFRVSKGKAAIIYRVVPVLDEQAAPVHGVLAGDAGAEVLAR